MDVIQNAKFSFFACYITPYYTTRIKQLQQNCKIKLPQTTHNVVNKQKQIR